MSGESDEYEEPTQIEPIYSNAPAVPRRDQRVLDESTFAVDTETGEVVAAERRVVDVVQETHDGIALVTVRQFARRQYYR